MEFCQKKQKNCAEDERDEAGDFWDHTALTADSKLMVSLVVGKRTKDQTHELVSDAKNRLRSGHLPVLLSDGDEGYEPAILDVFGRRYPAAISGSKGRPSNPVIRGKAKLQHTLLLLGYDKINTSVVERQNGTSRLHNQRKVRKTLAFSKSAQYHRWMSWLSVVQYNFCRAHGSLRIKDESRIHHRTPAMAAGLADRIWATRDWLLTPVLGGQE